MNGKRQKQNWNSGSPAPNQMALLASFIYTIFLNPSHDFLVSNQAAAQ
jgi:hypothetical protein